MEKGITIIPQLQQILSSEQLLISENDKAYYTRGFRVGHGQALAVAIPDSLLQLWEIIKVCVACDKIILMQASNTGVTGGSTPDGDNYDRDVVIISTRRLKGVQVIDNAQQVIAFPGSTLTELEKALAPHHKEPHSVIGSSCIGASVIGGVCNNSGGSLIRRGPAFTEKSLFAQIDDAGNLSLINHLGVFLGNTPEEMIARLESQDYTIGKEPTGKVKYGPMIMLRLFVTSKQIAQRVLTAIHNICTTALAVQEKLRYLQCVFQPSIGAIIPILFILALMMKMN